EKASVETAGTSPAVSNAVPVLAAQPAPSATATNKNGALAPNPNAPVAVTTVPSTPSPAAAHKHWKAELRLGADFLRGAKDQDTYYGRAKLTYERPYTSNPKEYFRSVLDYTLDYGRTEGVLSANRMYASDKTDLDIGKRWYLYNLAGIGYDEIRKIDIGFEVGPGLGYHLITASNLVMNVEAGLDYQAQYRSDNTRTKTYYPRLAEDVTWRLQKRLTLTEKLEYFPPVDSGGFRVRFESTLSFGFWEHLSLNLTALDLYDSEPASDVPNNDIQLRSSLGITF
ncbi:MAG TPA: DUF481 domain-containing protein, partial [Bacillota bacterium]|nr:DUF481 domain-containing protein [Bacillota bacterium]